MYEECQKKWVFNQTHPLDQRSDKKLGNQKQITTSSSHKTTGGTTSSSVGKPVGKGKGKGRGQDSAGKWMMYGEQGQPIDIDCRKMMSEERCFICQRRGISAKTA